MKQNLRLTEKSNFDYFVFRDFDFACWILRHRFRLLRTGMSMSLNECELGDDMAIAHPADLVTAPPFSDLFPISPVIRGQIAESIRKNSYDMSRPINVWRQRNVVVDGHTRRLAAIEAGSDVLVYFHDFADEGAALEYAIASQSQRRNLTDAEIRRCVKILDNVKKVGHPTGMPPMGGIPVGRSALTTAALLGVSARTVERTRRINSSASPEVLSAVDSGEMSIRQAERDLKGSPVRGTRSKQNDAARELVIVELRKDPSRTNRQIGGIVGCSHGVVARVRKAHGISGSGSKYSRDLGRSKLAPETPKAESSLAEIIEQPTPIQTDLVRPIIPFSADHAGLDPEEDEDRYFHSLWMPCQSQIVAMFEAFPARGRGHFLSKLRLTQHILAKRCPEIEDLTEQTNQRG